MMNKKCQILFLLLLLGQVSLAQEKIKFVNLNTSDGLSHHKVGHIIEDYLGDIWMATSDGLNRFDGTTFKVYRSEINAQADFYQINDVIEATDSTLWVGASRGGLSKFNRQEDAFEQYTDRDAYSLKGKNVTGITDDGHGNLIVLYEENNIALLDREKHVFFWEFMKEIATREKIKVVQSNQRGKVWLGTEEGNVYQLSYNGGKDYYSIAKKYAVGQGIKKIHLHKDTLWLVTEQGIYCLKPNESSFHYQTELMASLETNSIDDLLFDQDGYLWIGTDIIGLYRYNLANGELIDFKERGKNQTILGNGIKALLCDSKNNIWVGTFASGANVFKRDRHKFKEYMLIDGNTNPYKGTNVPYFSGSRDGKIWIANGGELSLFDHGKIQHYSDTQLDSLGILNKKVAIFYEDKAGNFWIGTRRNGISYIAKEKQQLTAKPKIKTTIIDIFETDDHQFYLGHGLGVIYLDQDLNMKELADQFPELKVQVAAFMQDVNGDMLFGAENGVYRYNAIRQSLTRFEVDNKEHHVSVRDILVDSKETIWVATFGSGLMFFDRASKKLKPIETDIPLASSFVKAIQEDNYGRIWFSSNKGISMYDPTSQNLFNYTTDDGLQGDSFIKGASYKDEEGIIYFGGFDGFNSLDPSTFDLEEDIQRVRVSNIHLLEDDQSVLQVAKDRHGVIHEVTLPRALSDFTVSLASAAFNYKKQPTFWYKLSGYNQDWIKMEGSKSVTFTNLDPGSYQLLVSPSRIPTESNISEVLKVEITPSWWQTIWAYMFYTLVVGLLIYLFREKSLANERLRSNLRIKEIESNKIKELNELKSSFFTNVSHEFRTPITLLLGPLESLMQDPKNPEKLQYKYNLMHKNAKVLLRLINQLLDTAKIEFGYMQLQITKGNIIEHIRDIYSSFEFMSESHRIEYTFECNFHNLRGYFDKDKVEKIAYNLLSNAFKFTKDGGEINVVLNLIPMKEKKGYANKLLFSVRDSGSGIAKKDLELIFSSFYQGDQLPERKDFGSGIGLSLTKQLVNLHKGKISVESTLGKGSLFSVEIPLDQDSFEEIIEESYTESPDRELNLEFVDTNSSDTDGLLNYENYDQVLIIDDNTDILDYLYIELGNKYKIYRAENGEEGYEKAVRNIPDLIISDIMMPETDGHALCKKLKSDPRTNHIPIIFITALTETKHKLKGLEIGADDYITKPFNIALLKQRVENIISSRSKLKKAYGGKKDLKEKPIYDDAFLQEVSDTIYEHIGDAQLSVEYLADAFNMTSTQLYRKIRGALNISPNEFIKFTRLNKAASILREGNDKNIAEVAFEVGFRDPSYFSRCFKKQFNRSPKDFANDVVKKH